MEHKYLSLPGKIMSVTSNQTKEEIISAVCEIEDGVRIMISMTPIVEIDGETFWEPNTEWGNFTFEQWNKKARPKLAKMYC